MSSHFARVKATSCSCLHWFTTKCADLTANSGLFAGFHTCWVAVIALMLHVPLFVGRSKHRRDWPVKYTGCDFMRTCFDVPLHVCYNSFNKYWKAVLNLRSVKGLIYVGVSLSVTGLKKKAAPSLEDFMLSKWNTLTHTYASAASESIAHFILTSQLGFLPMLMTAWWVRVPC